MEWLFIKIRNNWTAILVAFLAALSIGFPELYFIYDSGERYQGVPLMGTDAEEHYLASMREAYDGQYYLGNTYSQPKDIPYLYPEGGEVTVGVFSRISGIGVINFNILLKFLSPFILFLLLYRLVLLVDGRKAVALLSASFVILGSNLIARPHEILNFFTVDAVYHPGFNNYFRSINPEISSMLLFGYLILFYKFIKNPRILPAIFLGVILGASFYFYLFTWTFLLVLTGLFFAFTFIVKEKELIKKILLILATALFLSVPYWLKVLEAVSSPAYHDASVRFGLEPGRFLFLSGLLILLLGVFVFLFTSYFRGKKKKVSIFGALLALSVLVVYNQQLITGKSIQSSHYHMMITVPMVIVIAIIFGWTYFDKIKFLRSNFIRVSIISFAIIMLLINNFNWQMYSYSQTKNTAVGRQDYKKVINWLEQNVAKDNIIFASMPLSTLVPVFTPLDIYPSGFAQFYLLPREVFVQQIFLELRFAGLTPVEADERFLGDLRDKLSFGIYAVHYRNNMPDEVAIKLAKEYAVFYEEDFKKALDEDYYKPDYFVFDQKFNELALPESGTEDFMDRVAFLGDRFLVYKLK